VGNIAERGPLATVGGPRQHLQKSLEIRVSGCGFLYTKTWNNWKTIVQKLPKNAKKQLIENQRSTDYRNIRKMAAQFLYLACQGEVRTLVPR